MRNDNEPNLRCQSQSPTCPPGSGSRTGTDYPDKIGLLGAMERPEAWFAEEHPWRPSRARERNVLKRGALCFRAWLPRTTAPNTRALASEAPGGVASPSKMF